MIIFFPLLFPDPSTSLPTLILMCSCVLSLSLFLSLFVSLCLSVCVFLPPRNNKFKGKQSNLTSALIKGDTKCQKTYNNFNKVYTEAQNMDIFTCWGWVLSCVLCNLATHALSDPNLTKWLIFPILKRWGSIGLWQCLDAQRQSTNKADANT